MAATGKTPILLYGSTTATNAPTAGNLTNSSDGCEIAINVADKNLFFKDSTNVVNTVPIRQSSASSNGWLSSTDWNTFNGKASAFTYTTNYIPYGQGTTTPAQSSTFTFDGNTFTVGAVFSVIKAFASSNVGSVARLQVASAAADYAWYVPDNANYIGLYDYNAGAERITVNSTGDVKVGQGNLVIGTSGKGIDFSATPGTGTSELLADYEEGTATLTLTFGGGSTGIAYNSQQCRYTKIGNRVFIQASLALSNKGSSTGTALISGLPFTSANPGYGYSGLVFCGSNLSGLTGVLVPAVTENAATITLFQTNANGTTANITDANFSNTGYLMMSGHYYV